MEPLDPDFARFRALGTSSDGYLKPTSKAAPAKRAESDRWMRDLAFDIELPARKLQKAAGRHSSPRALEARQGVSWLGISRPIEEPRSRHHPPDQTKHESLQWWISRSTELPPHHRNGWVVSLILEQYKDEVEVASVLHRDTFVQRMQEAGLEKVLETGIAPRARCKALLGASKDKVNLSDEHAQRLMIKAIDRSIPSYISGIRCWAAFCDACGQQVHFPATETMVLRYMSMFSSSATMNQYFKHLRWSHRFLHMENLWQTPSIKQALNGVSKSGCEPRPRFALLSKQVRKVITQAEARGDIETAALAAISRLFLLRVPSEAIPLEWDGEHSRIELEEDCARLILMRRKNSRFPSILERFCCCRTSGVELCGVHWLHRLRADRDSGKLFNVSARSFICNVRTYAVQAKIPNASKLGTHAFRRGMAQDIISNGGTLAVLLKAGDWHSKAFLSYLRENQAQDEAVAQIVVNASDSEAEGP